MDTKKRGVSEINSRYQKIIRSMLLNNFVLNLNNVVFSGDPEMPSSMEDPSDDLAIFEDSMSVVGFCG